LANRDYGRRHKATVTQLKRIAPGKLRAYVKVIYLLALVIYGCDIPERPRILTISKVPDFRPSSPEDIQSVEQAIAAVITVCRDNSALPVVDPLYVHLYKNTASFAFYGRGWRTLPIDVGNLVAFAWQDKIHINLERIGNQPWGGLIQLLAHEYGHVIENSIVSRPASIKQWVAEGFADWVAVNVTHSLGWRDYEISLHATRRELIRHRDIVPHLSSLNQDRGWRALSQKPKGWIKTYGLAFVAVHKAIEDKGLGAILHYLKSADFETSFGMKPNDFGAELENDLLHGIRVNQELFTMNKPL
jgi:hypothetical protein